MAQLITRFRPCSQAGFSAQALSFLPHHTVLSPHGPGTACAAAAALEEPPLQQHCQTYVGPPIKLGKVINAVEFLDWHYILKNNTKLAGLLIRLLF